MLTGIGREVDRGESFSDSCNLLCLPWESEALKQFSHSVGNWSLLTFIQSVSPVVTYATYISEIEKADECFQDIDVLRF